MSLRTKFFKWLTYGQIQVTSPQEQMRLNSSGAISIGNSIATSPMMYRQDAAVSEEQPSVALKFIKAANGHVVEVSSFATNKHGHFERTVETYVVPEGGKISETVMQILAIKALEK
jgi:hypothetical protein